MTKKILFSWLLLIGATSGSLVIFPHQDIDTWQMILAMGIGLLAIISVVIGIKEPNERNKPIFINFAIMFGVSSLSPFSSLIGKAIFQTNHFASFYSYQYFTIGFFCLSLSIAIVYLVIDSLFYDWRTPAKYFFTFLIAGGVFVYYFHPFLVDPLAAYRSEEIIDFRKVRGAVEQLQLKTPTANDAVLIAEQTNLHAWKNGKEVGELFDDEKVKRVLEFIPYLEGSNSLVLLCAPLHRTGIYINVLCLVFISLFFGYQYKKDPPQGAYIEKILLLFVPYCSLEILHYYAYIKSVEYATYLDIFRIGLVLTLLNVLGLLLFFILRLRFITSIKGEFYEHELVSDSEHISRWRDAFDNLIVHHFLNTKTFHGRLLASRETRDKT
ncbi:MAG: hypothetical protein V1799_07215 [bacterium]